MKTLRSSLGVTRRDRIRNEQVRGTVKVESFGDEVREEGWRKEDVMRRESESIRQRMIERGE